jgi:hypothetical protein
MLPGSDDDGFPPEAERSSLRKPSQRQIVLTAVLTGILLIVGIVLLASKMQANSSNPATSAGAAGATAPGPGASTPGSGSSAPGPGSSTPGPGSTAPGPGTLPIGSPHSGSAVALELSLRAKLGGCWDDAEPGGTDGSYRRDFHFGSGLPCGGTGWDIDVELFDSNGHAAAAGARASRVQSTYRAGNMLVLVGPAADAGTRAAVAAEPGLSRVSPQ